MKQKLISIAFFLLLSGSFLLAQTVQIPQTISYQGVVTAATGEAVADKQYPMTFKLYNVLTEGEPLWQESQEVVVTNGLFNVILGSVNPLNLPFDQQYWLGIKVDDGLELKPRIALTSAPYSLNARSTIAEPQPGQSLVVKDQAGEATHIFTPEGNVGHKGIGFFGRGIVAGLPDTTVQDSGGVLAKSQNVGDHGTVSYWTSVHNGTALLSRANWEIVVGPGDDIEFAFAESIRQPDPSDIPLIGIDVPGAVRVGPTAFIIKSSGRVGLGGNVDPRGRLDIARPESEGSIFGVDKIVGANDLRFYTDDKGETQAMIILGNGNVGIGEKNPDTKLHVGFSGADGILIDGDGSGDARLQIENGGGSHFIFDDDDDRHALKIESAADRDLAFNTNGANEAMRITSGGSVGIGMPPIPAAKLAVGGRILIKDGSQGEGKVLTSDFNGLAFWQVPAGVAEGWTDDGAVVRLTTTTDRVGIGIDVPDEDVRLHVAEGTDLDETKGGILVVGMESISANGLRIDDDEIQAYTEGTATGATLFLQKEGTGNLSVGKEYLYVSSTGDVGIGTPMPEERLDVVGTVQMKGFKMPEGAVDGHILTSDGAGVGTWRPAAAGGLACWDLNGNGIGDAGEDTNSDGAFDALDCQGPAGPPGAAGGESWLISGNAGTDPAENFLGTTDDTPLELRVNGQRALLIIPTNGIPNIIGGHGRVIGDVEGATIGGGGDENFLNVVLGNLATIGGGVSNIAGEEGIPYATIGGGHINTASGEATTIGGGHLNTASGVAATIGGGQAQRGQ